MSRPDLIAIELREQRGATTPQDLTALMDRVARLEDAIVRLIIHFQHNSGGHYGDENDYVLRWRREAVARLDEVLRGSLKA